VPTIIRASVNAETGHSGLPVLRRRGVPTASEGGGEQPGGETGGADHDGLGGQQPTAVGRGGQRDADQPAPVLAGDEDRGHHDQRDQPEERPGQRPLPGDDISGVPGVGTDVSRAGHGDRAGALAKRAGQRPGQPTWRKTPVAVVALPAGGAAAKGPACSVEFSRGQGGPATTIAA
jgi:hypothetical protein